MRSATLSENTGGFTLLEALMGITILAFGLMAIVTMLSYSAESGNLSKNTTKATHMAAWMMDRIKQDTSLHSQVYSTFKQNLLTFDNDATAGIVIDTNIANDPIAEPGRTACQEWRALLQGRAVPGYMTANQLPGDRLPGARGVVTILPDSVNPDRGGNHVVVVQVTWQGIAAGPVQALLPTRRGVRLESVLSTAMIM